MDAMDAGVSGVTFHMDIMDPGKAVIIEKFFITK
jgi:hypothetical protein